MSTNGTGGIDAAELARYLGKALDVARFRDYCPNGLQVACERPIRCLVTAVTASRAAIESAIEARADALLVHHGLFWRGEDPCLVGFRYQRIKALMQHGIGLFAYHLPLDAHPEWGNNIQLARRVGWHVSGAFGGDPPLALVGEIEVPMAAEELGLQLGRVLGRAPLVIPGGTHPVRRLGWCTGAAQDHLEAAASEGLDAFVSGEISERTVHLARELGIHYLAAGHHATETGGVQALAAHLAGRYGLEWRYVELDNPV